MGLQRARGRRVVGRDMGSRRDGLVGVSLAGDKGGSVGSVGERCPAGWRALSEAPETAFGFCHCTAAGATMTGAAELPGPLSIARLAQEAVLTSVLLCCRSTESVARFAPDGTSGGDAFSAAIGHFFDEEVAALRPRGHSRGGEAHGPRRSVFKWRGGGGRVGKGPAAGLRVLSGRRAAGARAVCCCCR